MSDYEAVYTITHWYDGARVGIANLKGEPHYYENHWNEDKNDWSEIYFLEPIDAETFELAMEIGKSGCVGNALLRRVKQSRKHIRLYPKINNGIMNLRRL